MAADYLSAIGGGSGLNITELTESLVEAERAPQQAILDRTKEKAELSISAYGVVTSAVQTLKASFAALDDVTDLVAFDASSSSESVLTATANSSATRGSYQATVNSLAERDTWTFDGLDSTTDTISVRGNPNAPFTVDVTIDGVASQISVTDKNLAGIAAAINASGLGLTATIVDSGASSGRYVLMVSGETGADNSFSITSDGLSGESRTTTASDLQFTLNGVTIERPTNTVSDVIDGVTFRAVSTGSTTVGINSDTSALKARLLAMVDAYNGVQTVFNTLKNSSGSSDDELAGALATDSTFRTLISSIRSNISGEISTSSGDINYLTDLGIGFDRSGFLQVNDAVLDDALANDLTDVVEALSAGTNEQSVYGTADRGLAGDMYVLLDKLNRSDGVITTLVNNADSRLLAYESDLMDLDARMERIKERYLTQFSMMERIVGEMKSTGDYLANQLALNSKD
jgi:flagellar hook-associated protein 2